MACFKVRWLERTVATVGGRMTDGDQQPVRIGRGDVAADAHRLLVGGEAREASTLVYGTICDA